MTTLDSIRAKSEADFIDKLKTLGERHRRKLIAARKRYGSVKAIPETVWAEIAKDTEAETTALLLLIFIAGYVFTLDSLPGLRRRDGMPTDEAKRFATRRGKAFGEGYAETTRKRWEELEDAIDDLGKDQTQKARLEATERGLGEILSTGRAEGAGITETTGGLSAGQRQAGDDGRAFNPGVTVTLFWRTEKDEKVCPVCKPLDGKSEAYCESIGIGQPAHPRCRCEWVAKIEAGVSESVAGRDGDGDGLINDGKPDEGPAPAKSKSKINPKVLAWAEKKFGDKQKARNFAEWFGESKVVDENGEPLVVYHGTAADFDEFDVDRAGTIQYSDWGKGVYLEPDESGADYYRVEAVKRLDKEYNDAFARYEKLEKGTKVVNGTPQYSEETIAALKDFQRIGREKDKTESGKTLAMYASIKNPYIQEYSSTPNSKLAASAKSKGHDGIFVMSGDGEINEIVAFDGNQVKSTSNNGNYSRQSNKINESL